MINPGAMLGYLASEILFAYWTMEDEKVIGGNLPMWRRAIVLHFLVNRTSIRIQLKVVRPVNRKILLLLGESEQTADKILDLMHGSALTSAEDSYKILSKWARGESTWGDTWPEYMSVLSGKRIPDNLKNLADELARIS